MRFAESAENVGIMEGNDEMGIALGIINLADIRYIAAERQKNAADSEGRGRVQI